MHLGHSLKVHNTVMVAQYLSKGVGLYITDRRPIVELVLDGIVKVHCEQSIMIVILNAYKEVICFRNVRLADGDGLIWLCYLDSSDLGAFVCVDKQDVISKARKGNEWPAHAKGSQRTEDVVVVHLIFLHKVVSLHPRVDFWKETTR